jgi:hypothetical protein
MQLKVLLRGSNHPLTEDAVLTTHLLQLVRCVGGLLRVCLQTHMLLDDNATGVVLEVEQVLRVVGHLRPSSTELWAGEVTSGLEVLVPLGLLLLTDRKEHDRHVTCI